eukprot:snap_masked-scaffold_23-processed-gene-1.29-mRNA-1 protein AED:1.00 eAED:1.00 QI:0/-1/0/0/-1/1/1/0/372
MEEVIKELDNENWLDEVEKELESEIKDYKRQKKKIESREYRINKKKEREYFERNEKKLKSQNKILLEKVSDLNILKEKLEENKNNLINLWSEKYLLLQNNLLRQNTKEYKKHVFLLKKLHYFQTYHPRYKAEKIIELTNSSIESLFSSFQSARILHSSFKRTREIDGVFKNNDVTRGINKQIKNMDKNSFQIKAKSVCLSTKKNGLVRVDFIVRKANLDDFIETVWFVMVNQTFSDKFRTFLDIELNVFNLSLDQLPKVLLNTDQENLRIERYNLVRYVVKHTGDVHYLGNVLLKGKDSAVVLNLQLVWDEEKNEFIIPKSHSQSTCVKQINKGKDLLITACNYKSREQRLEEIVYLFHGAFKVYKNKPWKK